MPSSFRVAVVLATFSESGRAVLRGVASYAARVRNWNLYTGAMPLVEPGVLREALRADGLITWLLDDVISATLRDAQLPIVAVHSGASLPIASVSDNNRRIAELAADHFISQGFRHFGFFGIERRVFSMDRAHYFQAVLAERGMTCHFHYSTRGDQTFAVQLTDDPLVSWLRSLPKPIGILAANDCIGLHLMLNAKHAGIRVPDEVAVVGVDNDELMCRVTSPPMSSIDPNGIGVGFMAAELLDRQMHGETVRAEKVRVEPAQLVVRQSSDVIAVGDPDVAAAVRFIRENTARNLNVDDVVEELAVARRTLERSFRTWLGRSIYDEIAESRIRLAKQLLIDTDLGISDITAACGFKYRSHLNAVFLKRAGRSPAAFRKCYRAAR